MKVIDLMMGEDIRHEVGNKYSLMGIWADSVTLSGPGGKVQFPVPLRMATFARVLLADGEILPDLCQLKITFDNKPVADVEARLTVNPGAKLISFPFPTMNLNIPAPGTLTCKVVLKAAGKTLLEVDNPCPIVVKGA